MSAVPPTCYIYYVANGNAASAALMTDKLAPSVTAPWSKWPSENFARSQFLIHSQSDDSSREALAVGFHERLKGA